MKLPLLCVLLVLFAQAQQPKLEFEVATVKPSDPNARGSHVNNSNDGGKGRFEGNNLTLKQLIVIAYHVRKEQVSGGQAWTGNDHFDVQAKYDMPASLTNAQRLMAQRQLEERVSSLLTDRFQLAVKIETRDMPVYALVIGKNGPKLQPAKDLSGDRQGTNSRNGTMKGTSADLEDLANALGYHVDKPVLDKTGVKGRYDWQLDWTPEPPAGAAAPELSGPSIFTALQDQLGLKLESQKVAMPFIVIERAEKPSAN